MVNLELTDEQVVGLVKQLPRERKDQILRLLMEDGWLARFAAVSHKPDRARQLAAERGLEWEKLSEEAQYELLAELAEAP